MLYHIGCAFSYSILNQPPLPIHPSSSYECVGKSLYYPRCFLMKESGDIHAQNVIVPEDKIQEISSINLESEEASS